MTLAVNHQSAQVKEMAAHWPIIDALMGGTAAMRAKRDLLPQQPMEDDEAYEYRLDVATLFPAYSRTVGVMAGKPFAKEVTFTDVPPEVEKLLDNIDNQGGSAHAVLSAKFFDLMSHGYGGILVDHTASGDVRTLADAKAAGARPYWVPIKHDQILGWQTDAQGLSQIRLAETAEVPDGEFGTKTVSRVRVLERGKWRLFEQQSNAWNVVAEGTMSLKRIPFVFLLGTPTGANAAKPPLFDLAYLNVKHWQEQSDQDDSTRFARKRLLVAIGLDGDSELEASSSAVLKLPIQADMKVVQGSAEAVTVGRSELDALEDQMIQTGAELLTKSQALRTATEASNDAEANKSSLQRIAEQFEDAADQALQFTAEWMGLPDGGHVSLFKDFASNTLSDASANLVLSLSNAGLITKETALNEYKRRAVLSPDLDVEKELDAIAEQGPSSLPKPNDQRLD